MDAIQRQLLNAKKKDLERQRKAEERAQRPFEEATATDKERQKEAVEKSTESDQFTPEQQMEAGGELYKQQVAAKKGKTGEEGPGAAEAEGEEKGSVKGLWNKLQKMKEEARKDEMQKVTSQQAFQVLQKQAQDLVRQGWSAVHEAVEDLALSFIDLTILTGPLCGLVLFIRILGFAIWPPISVKGVEVSLFPWFSLPGDFARVKSLLALIISGIFWTIIICIIYAFNNPLSTLAEIIGLK